MAQRCVRHFLVELGTRQICCFSYKWLSVGASATVTRRQILGRCTVNRGIALGIVLATTPTITLQCDAKTREVVTFIRSASSLTGHSRICHEWLLPCWIPHSSHPTTHTLHSSLLAQPSSALPTQPWPFTHTLRLVLQTMVAWNSPFRQGCRSRPF